MMKFWEDWKEKLKKFLKADVLAECRQQVDHENRVVLCVLNSSMVCLSFMLAFYILWRKQADYYHEHMCILYAALFLILLFVSFYSKRDSGIRLSVLIAVEYVAIGSCFAMNHIIFGGRESTTAYYLLVGLAFCFLVRPIQMYLMQAGITCILAVSSCLVREWNYAKLDLINTMLMFGMSVVLSSIVMWFRMEILKKLDDREKVLGITELYQSVLDESQTAAYVRDICTYEVLYLNRKAKEIFHINEKYAGKNCYTLFYQQKIPCQGCPAAELKRDKIWQREKKINERFYQAKGKIIDWCGREAYVEYLTDITDTKKMETQMRTAHEKLQQKYQEEMMYRDAVSGEILTTSRLNLTKRVIEDMRVGTKDGYEKMYAKVTDFRSRMYAYAKKVYLTEEQNQRLSPDGMLDAFKDGVNSLSEEYVAQLDSGRYVWVRVEVNLLQKPENGEIIAFIYNHDVTRESKLKQILECIMAFGYDEIYTVDEYTGQMDEFVSGQYALDSQAEQNQYEGELQCLADRVETPEEKKRLSEAMELSNIREHLKSQDVYIVEVPLRSKNGKYRQKQIRCMYLNQQTGTLLLMLSDVEDIVKEEKEKQEQLEKALKMAEAANEAKTKFLAGMSHEIRTPMNAIIGLNSMIRSSLDDREQVLDYTEKLDSASQYLLALLNDILDMSRIESGSMKLAIRAFEGDKFWDNVNMLAKAQAVMAGVGYSFERRKKISEVYIGDSTRLEQIMVNLINNAVKFTPKGGNVNVSVAEQETDGRVQLTAVVSDNGIGIAKDFLPKVFEIFTQEHEENTRVYGGSGLGLSIARNYARMMDGDITVESAEGKGTVFTVTAKLDFDRRKKARKERTENISFEGKRILLVEDHPLNVIVAKGLLEKKQFEVVTAENGKKAVELVTDAPEYYFDAILMDIRMPVLDGIEAARQIRALDRADVKELPIIAMTANAGDEDRRQTKEAGMNEHLAKPIDPKLLYTTLQKFILP